MIQTLDEDDNDLNVGTEDWNVETEIARICQMDAADAKSNSRVSKVSLPQLKLMAKHLNISTSQKKEALVDAIRDKVNRKKLLGEKLTEKEAHFVKIKILFLVYAIF